jgi:glycogen phosphorylase
MGCADAGKHGALTPRFSADRTVREYTEQHYLPAATAYRERTANKGAVARQMLAWQQDVDRKWGSLRFGGRHVETTADHHVFEVEIFLNDLGKNAARVELYADAINGGDPVRQEMKWERLLPGAPEGSVYQATVPASRPPGDYTARAMPQSDGTSVPLEDTRILWQR